MFSLALRARAELEYRRRVGRSSFDRPPPRALFNDFHPRQQQAYESEATELLYGGAAIGGKSHFIRGAFIRWALAIPGLQLFLFRRTHPELLDSHMSGPTGFPAMLAPLVESGDASINWGKLEISFPRLGSAIKLRHCQYEKDVYKYLSSEMHVLALDEATWFTNFIYRMLRSRVRIPKAVQLPAEFESFRAGKIILATNPGGPGHNWVKSGWIDPAPPFALWRSPDGGMLRQFIPAKREDNPSAHASEEYGEKLRALPPHIAKAMDEGRWDIVAGGAIDDLWMESVHVIEPFPIPSSWTISRALDWGSSKPFSVGWWAQSDGTEAELRDGSRRSWPRGTWFRIAEWYGSNGQPNEGLKMLASEAGRRILEMEAQMGIAGRVQVGPADSSIFDAEEGDSIAQKFERAGVGWLRADKSPGSRKAGLEEVRSLLTASLAKPMEDKGLFIFETCRDFIRTVPELPRGTGAKNQDDVDSDAEDHIWDEMRYRVMAPVPPLAAVVAASRLFGFSTRR